MCTELNIPLARKVSIKSFVCWLATKYRPENEDFSEYFQYDLVYTKEIFYNDQLVYIIILTV